MFLSRNGVPDTGNREEKDEAAQAAEWRPGGRSEDFEERESDLSARLVHQLFNGKV